MDLGLKRFIIPSILLALPFITLLCEMNVSLESTMIPKPLTFSHLCTIFVPKLIEIVGVLRFLLRVREWLLQTFSINLVTAQLDVTG